MIITCNCGEKKFTLPDNSIPAAGRMVQCGFCGLKWKQFPVNDLKETQPVASANKVVSRIPKTQQKTQAPKKDKKTKVRKSREIDLYSPEYLAKKHGIKLSDDNYKKTLSKDKVTFGFYNSLLLFIVLIIFLSRGLYFSQDFVVQKLPFTEFYIDYFFESMRNIFEIWKNLITSY